MNIFLILPNQLFEITSQHLKTSHYDKIIIYEEPHYFSSDIKPNKIKIAFLRSCMKCYYDKLKKEGFNITYVEFHQSSPLTTSNNYYCYELTDFKLTDKYKKFKINELTTPMFILTKSDLDIYNKKQSISHASLYELSKKKLNLLQGVKNQDVYNRSSPRKNIPLNTNLNFITSSNKHYYEEGIKYANSSYFKSHYGNPTLEYLKIYPINSKDSYEAFKTFLSSNLDKFGLFQDVIQDTNPFMYHSIISPMLNNGLLSPLHLIEIIRDFNKTHKIPLNAYEGFLRQIIGWREYMRYIYLYKYNELISSNNHKNYKSLDKSWYTATTGILIIDTEINKALKYGYAHHIIRLMVFLNFMILNEINPNDIYKWFMEVISIDAYDWVMISNIYSMGYFSKIGMKRPYLSSSNYLLKMSNYKKDGKWDTIWTDKFRSFVKSRKINFYLRSIK